MIKAAIKPKQPEGLQMALFGATTLLGKALRESLARRAFPAHSLRLFDQKTKEGHLTAFQGEAMLVMEPDPDLLDRIDLAFLCGGAEECRAYLGWPAKKEFVAIDLSMASNGNPAVPVIHFRLNRSRIHLRERIIVSASPIAQALSTILAPLHETVGVSQAVATVFVPASDRGNEGLDELYRQTVNLLNFQEFPRKVFPHQIAFNLVPRMWFQQPRDPLGSEKGMIQETLRILEADLSLHIGVILAPVFHCHSILLWVRCRRGAPAEEIQEAFRTQEDITVLEGRAERFTPVDLAGEDRIHVQLLGEDGRKGKSHWIWLVSDSLRTGAAENAVRIAEWLIGRGET